MLSRQRNHNADAEAATRPNSCGIQPNSAWPLATQPDRRARPMGWAELGRGSRGVKLSKPRIS